MVTRIITKYLLCSAVTGIRVFHVVCLCHHQLKGGPYENALGVFFMTCACDTFGSGGFSCWQRIGDTHELAIAACGKAFFIGGAFILYNYVGSL